MCSMVNNQFNVVRHILNKSLFDEHIIYIILTYYWNALDKHKVLLHWIDINNLDWHWLSVNPNAISLLKNNYDKINWLNLSGNELLNTNVQEHTNNIYKKLYWSWLSRNPNCIEILENNLHKIDWTLLSGNPNAICLIKDRIEYEKQFNIDEYDYLSFGCKLLSWCEISNNPNAIEILENNQDKIDWHLLSVNPSIFVDEPMPF